MDYYYLISTEVLISYFIDDLFRFVAILVLDCDILYAWIMNLSFAGCGFLGIYHVGVAVCFKKYAPHLLLGKISGASFGAISACALLCDLPIGKL